MQFWTDWQRGGHMKYIPITPKITQITRALILLILMLALAAPGEAVPASTLRADRTTWALAINQPKDPICVGDAVNVTIQWAPAPPDPKSELAPLAPLTGPTRIKLQASRGHFYPDPAPTPGSVSGTMTVTYIAEQEGSEKLFAQAWIGATSDAIATDTFTIKTCKYHFRLDGTFTLGVTDPDVSYTVLYTIKSRGTLEAPDPDYPLQLEGKMKTVRLNAVVTSFASKCVLFTYEPGSGGGFVDAKASPGPMGIGMFLELDTKDLQWDVDYSFACDGNSQTLSGVFPIKSSLPLVGATFLDGSGTQNVKLDMFEIPFNRLNGSPGISVSYTATLTLEKEAPK
jgi:hypothetical protein